MCAQVCVYVCVRSCVRVCERAQDCIQLGSRLRSSTTISPPSSIPAGLARPGTCWRFAVEHGIGVGGVYLHSSAAALLPDARTCAERNDHHHYVVFVSIALRQHTRTHTQLNVCIQIASEPLGSARIITQGWLNALRLPMLGCNLNEQRRETRHSAPSAEHRSDIECTFRGGYIAVFVRLCVCLCTFILCPVLLFGAYFKILIGTVHTRQMISTFYM